MTSLVNPYFNQSKGTEQALLNGLITESIQVLGHTFYYLPRNVQVEDLVMGEDVLSKFTLAIPLEMYMQDVQGFEGDKEIFSKFGLEIRNSFKLVVSVDRWEREVKSQFDGEANNGEANFTLVNNIRPQEGDLIYDPLTTHLFEIKFVDHDYTFFQLGKNYMYHFSCEMFQYNHEEINTGIADIDAFHINNTLDDLSFQILTETGDALVQELDCDAYILIEHEHIDERNYGTNFNPDAILIEFDPVDPFSEL
jgi:hypothetical protein